MQLLTLGLYRNYYRIVNSLNQWFI